MAEDPKSRTMTHIRTQPTRGRGAGTELAGDHDRAARRVVDALIKPSGSSETRISGRVERDVEVEGGAPLALRGFESSKERLGESIVPAELYGVFC